MQADGGQLLKAANHVLQFTMFHLVKELRDAGIEGQIHDLPPALKAALLDAIFGGITEINSDIQAAQIEDWDSNSKVWALLFIFGESNKDEALLEISRINSGAAGEEFVLCGMYAARSLTTALECGDIASAWLDSYEGMFAAMARLSKAIA